jgi:hypothetical protein
MHSQRSSQDIGQALLSCADRKAWRSSGAQYGVQESGKSAREKVGRLTPWPFKDVKAINDGSLCACGHLATFQLTVEPLNAVVRICEACVREATYKLLDMADDVPLEEIRKLFPGLRDTLAADAPVGYSFYNFGIVTAGSSGNCDLCKTRATVFILKPQEPADAKTESYCRMCGMVTFSIRAKTNEFPFLWMHDASGSCKCCSAPSNFRAGYADEMHYFCRVCFAPFVLQTLKCNGVELGMIEAGFLKLSAAVDAPLKSLWLQ